jgi:hypothetical protein
MIHKTVHLSLAFIFMIHLMSCAHEFGSVVITKPDEYTHVYEAKEKVALKAIAAVLKEKSIGENISIDFEHNRVDSDYVVADDWRTKTTARVKQLNWKECEVRLIVTTEKKTDKGWEMRRLLNKDQYDSFFSVIDLKIYEEMSRIK